MHKKIISTLMVCSIMLTAASSLPAIAKADDYDSKIEQQNKKIDALKTKEIAAEDELATIEADIFKTEAKINELTEKKEKMTAELKQLYDDLSDLNVRIQKREIQMQNQARNVQVSGEGAGYLDIILNSGSISEAISRANGISTLVNANNNLLTQQTEDKKEMEDKTVKAESQVTMLDTATRELNDKKDSLSTLKIEQEVAKNDLEAQRTTEEDKKAEFVSLKGEAEQKLLSEQEKQKAAAEKVRKEAEEAAKNAAKFHHTTNIIEENGTTSKKEIPGNSGNTSSIGGDGKVSEKKKAAAQIALNSVGQTNPTGWGQSGECIVAVQNWLNAAGITFKPGGPHSGYTQSGAVQVSWSEVQVGDVVQYENALSPDAWLDGVHTVLVVGVNNGVAQIVESNNPGGSGYVSTTTGWVPSPYAANFRAVVWRFPG